MAAGDIQLSGVALHINGLLGTGYGRRRLDGEAEKYFVTVGYTAEDASGIVGDKGVAAGTELIVVFAAAQCGAGEAVAEFNTFDGTQREHGVCQHRIQFVENRFAPTGGDTGNFAAHHSAGTLFVCGGSCHCGNHFFCGSRIGRTGGIFFDFICIECGGGDTGDLLGPGGDFDSLALKKQFGDGSGGDSGGSLSAG